MLRVAAVQAEPVPGELAANLASAVEWIERAAAREAELVVFPEAFTTGYGEETFRDLYSAGELPGADLAWCEPVREAADRARVVVFLNTPLDHGTHRTLSTVVLRPGHVPVAAYDKQHLDETEQSLFTPGDHGTTILIEDVNVALSICYDSSFPEHAADAADHEEMGADLYVNSGAYFPGGEHRRDLHHAARALDNGLYVVHAGLVGGPHGFIGGSAAFDPEGRLLEQLPAGVEGLVVVDVDRIRIARIRVQQRMWLYRRSSLGERRYLPGP